MFVYCMIAFVQYKVMFYPLSASTTTASAAAPQKRSFSAYKDQLSVKTVAWYVPPCNSALAPADVKSSTAVSDHMWSHYAGRPIRST
jgi:hypothetical protein